MKNTIYLALFSLFVLAACSQKGDAQYSPAAVQDAAMVRPVSEKSAPAEDASSSAATRRYLALKHNIDLWVPEHSLAQHFKSIQEQCIKLGCEILEADQSMSADHQSANASLTARVPPAAFATFFSGIQNNAKLRRHHSESADKTAEVIDVEARIKNLEALKARVLELLASKTGNLKDMLEAEKQLSETQTELDSINGQRRALASLTDMVRVEITLSEESLQSEGKMTAPVAQAVHDAGNVLMSSLGVLITVAVALLPWALVLGVLTWRLRLAWRRRRAAKAAMAAALQARET